MVKKNSDIVYFIEDGMPIRISTAQLVMEGLELWQKNSEFFVQKSVIS